ncbi:MAG TPA: trehalose-phosphatase [Rubricoccaceae bacterium]|nr:trehalose-phosphatase [Rubricoccaceae bacterium]
MGIVRDEGPPVPAQPLLFLDYDGTLAPLVEDPAAAHPHPEVPVLLRALAARHPVWVVTGRDLAALARLLPDVRVRCVGLHGAEEGVLGEAATRSAFEAHGEALRRLRASVPAGEGICVEDKGGTAFAVHYRNAPDPDAARALLEAWAAAVPDGLEALWGKRVVECRPKGVSKGVAVARLAAEHPGRTPVYLGDDVTDEEAFRALAAAYPGAVMVKVGEGETAARYRLPDVEAAVAYLRRFLNT